MEKLTDGKVTIKYVMPDQFHPQLKLKYQNLMLSRMSDRDFEKIIKDTNPQAVHVMVEGSLGKRARSYLIKHGIPFTTAYHSMFPEFVRDTLPDAPKLLMVEAAHQMGKVAKAAATPFGDGAVAKAGALADKAEAVADRAGDAVGKVTAPVIKPLQEPVRLAVNKSLRDFHSASEGVMVPTRSMAENLVDNGYNPDQLRYWSHGVDTELFNPSKADPKVYQGLQRPISLFVGRVAAEKNLEDFLKMDIPGTKVGRRWRPGSRSAESKISQGCILRRKKLRRSAEVLCFIRRLRLSKPNRHLRPRATRSQRFRRSGRCLQSAGPGRCDHFAKSWFACRLQQRRR